VSTDGNGGNGGYTGAMQQVLIQLGRIDGKLDNFDVRVRSLEEQQAAWRELVKVSEADSSQWKDRIVRNEVRLDVLEDRDKEKFSIRRHWRWLLVAALPTALVIVNIIDTIGDIQRGVLGGG
jgi:hypothetical protein